MQTTKYFCLDLYFSSMDWPSCHESSVLTQWQYCMSWLGYKFALPECDSDNAGFVGLGFRSTGEYNFVSSGRNWPCFVVSFTLFLFLYVPLLVYLLVSLFIYLYLFLSVIHSQCVYDSLDFVTLGLLCLFELTYQWTFSLTDIGLVIS